MFVAGRRGPQHSTFRRPTLAACHQGEMPLATHLGEPLGGGLRPTSRGPTKPRGRHLRLPHLLDCTRERAGIRRDRESPGVASQEAAAFASVELHIAARAQELEYRRPAVDQRLGSPMQFKDIRRGPELRADLVGRSGLVQGPHAKPPSDAHLGQRQVGAVGPARRHRRTSSGLRYRRHPGIDGHRQGDEVG